jgi:hypothetical protein
MAKESGLGMTCTVDDVGGTGRAITNDVSDVQIGTPNSLQDVTGLDKSAIERLILLADGSVTLQGFFNPAANLSHDVFKEAGQTAVGRTVVIVHSGQTFTAEMHITSYVVARGADGSLTWTAALELSNGTAPAWS